MASVWVARLRGQLGFEKLVAVKTILPHVSHDLRFQQMFLDEARIASGIDHVNVARILDLGEQHGLLYLVMEWISGDSLASLHRAVKSAGALVSPGVALRAVADACAGLHAAHELRDRKGALLDVVHRDVSPQNILVSTEGVAKVIDFGIAKAQSRIAGDTSDGALKGKLAYMAPEQALGRPVDRRADIWSMGAVLYHLLSGTPPFKGETEAATFAFITSGLPPQPLAASIPGPIAAVVRRALGPLDQRYSTAAELQRAIEGALRETGLATTTAEVAAYVQSHLGERVSARKTLIDQAIESLASQESAARGGLNTTASPWARQGPEATAPKKTSVSSLRTVATRAGMAALLIAAGAAVALVRVRSGTAANADSVQNVSPAAPSSEPLGVSTVPPLGASAPEAAEPPPTAAAFAAASSATAPSREKVRHTPPAKATVPSCEPPYTIDANGVRHYKRACVH